MTYLEMAVVPTSAALATEMIALFGDKAGQEAARRADRFRDAGNAIIFCNWRQAERLIVVLSTDRAHGTVQ